MIQIAPSPTAIRCGAIGSGIDREKAPRARRDLEETVVERVADRPDRALPYGQPEERRSHVLGRRRRRHGDDRAVNTLSLPGPVLMRFTLGQPEA